MELLAALTLGLFGSLHCIGMCGPLMLAVPTNSQNRGKFLLERIVYNGGKAVTYGILGAVLGLAGRSMLMSIQQNLSIIIGISLLITVAIPLGLQSKLDKISPLRHLYTFVKIKFSSLMKRRGYSALALMGMLNGLLPCGLVYTALIGATVVADAWHSAVFMMVFGVGTMPALIIVAMSGKLISVKYRSLFTRAVPVFSIALALILILRGLNLGIPMVSPKVVQTVTHEKTEKTMDCCKE
ncbi:MAG: sulfite exporter TauE/SafE family protein [Bacteroidota bacterium]